MKRIVIGFTLIFISIALTWLFRETIITGVLIPITLGAYKVGRLINTLPQIVWWIILTIASFSLFFARVTLPSIRILKRKTQFLPRGRLDIIENLINESDKGSLYSSQQLALQLNNMYRKMNNLEELSIHKLEDEMKKGNLPEELVPYTIMQFGKNTRRRDLSSNRLALEKAVRFLKEGEMNI